MIIADKIFRSYLDPGEKILDICHRHPVIMTADLGRVLFFGFLIPAFLYYLFPNYWIFFGIWIAISILRALRVVLIWYHDVLLITDASLMDVYWNGIFSRTSSRLEYGMIEGVTIEISGIWKVVFNYGDVKVQGAGGGAYINLRDAINPKRVEKRIMHHQEKFVNNQSMKDSESLKNLLTSLIRQHIQNEELENINR